MKKLLILSGKGGTGKTTVSATLIDLLNANAFADCDVDAPNLHLIAGLTTQPTRKDYYGAQKASIDPQKCTACGLCQTNCHFDAITISAGHAIANEFACEGCGVCAYVCPQDAITLTPDVAGEQMLFCGKRTFSTATLKMGRGNSGKLVTEVKQALYQTADASLAIIDGSPGIGCPVIASVTGVDLVLIVTEPSLCGIHDMERILHTTKMLGVPTAVCVNKANAHTPHTAAIEAYCVQQGVPFVGQIPYDKQASLAINEGHSLAQVDCPAQHAIKALLKRTMALLE